VKGSWHGACSIRLMAKGLHAAVAFSGAAASTARHHVLLCSSSWVQQCGQNCEENFLTWGCAFVGHPVGRGVVDVDDAALHSLTTACSSLSSLDISKCPRVTSHGASPESSPWMHLLGTQCVWLLM
jgi:hypothetical protein